MSKSTKDAKNYIPGFSFSGVLFTLSELRQFIQLKLVKAKCHEEVVERCLYAFDEGTGLIDICSFTFVQLQDVEMLVQILLRSYQVILNGNSEFNQKGK